jgi:hypothetical protein
MCRVKTRLTGAQRPFLILCTLIACACAGARARDWTLSDASLGRLDRREVLLPPDPKHDGSSFRAAIEVDAPAERVFRIMTDCAQALKFVPGVTRCSVLETALDGSWQTILHEGSYGVVRVSRRVRAFRARALLGAARGFCAE